MKWSRLFSQYFGLSHTLFKYWSAYGGWKAFLASPYLLVSVLFVFFVYNNATEKALSISHWLSMVMTVSPSLLGFALAGLAVFLGVGDNRFRDAIRGKASDESEESPFLTAVASFLHFTLFQALTLVNAIIGQSIFGAENFFYFIFSMWLFIYAALLSIAAIFSVFKLAEWYDNMPKE